MSATPSGTAADVFVVSGVVRNQIGAIATPEVIHPASSLPKTRSGKVMRRILRKIARDDHELGDMSTLADDSIIEELLQSKCLYASGS